MVVLHTAIAIVLVIGLIIRGRVDPVISLVLGSLYLGLGERGRLHRHARGDHRSASARSWPRSAS